MLGSNFRAITIKNGKKEGTWFTYGADGGHIKQEYENGIRHGAIVSYFGSGKLQMRGNYKNGQLDGYCERYLENGDDPAGWCGTYKNGVKVSD